MATNFTPKEFQFRDGAVVTVENIWDEIDKRHGETPSKVTWVEHDFWSFVRGQSFWTKFEAATGKLVSLDCAGAAVIYRPGSKYAKMMGKE